MVCVTGEDRWVSEVKLVLTHLSEGESARVTSLAVTVQ